jgi:hypothetical protein
VPSLLLRRIHKWIGLILGLQFLLWTLSGAMMAVLDMEDVAGGPSRPAVAAPPIAPSPAAWAAVRGWVEEVPVTSLAVRPLLERQVIEVGTPAGTLLFDGATGRRIRIDAALARTIAAAAYPGDRRVTSVTRLTELTLAVRRHQLPIWRVDFADEEKSSYYVSGSTGKLLERRNDTWRVWDFFWMLHNMDYARRESFNHPVIVTLTFATLWLAVTGLWLLFRTAWAPDIRALRRRRARER